MNMPLVLLNRRRRGFTAFSPSTLFALSEPGVWFDPSDLTTLFTDPAGTTPVTAPGDTVGLMLDKSKGLALGAELVNDGTFSGGTVPTGWVSAAGSASVSGGQFNVVASGGAYSGMEYSVAASTQAGRSYIFEATLVSGTGRITVQEGVAGDTPNIDYTGPQTFRFVVQRGVTGNFRLLLRTSASGGTTVWDNISVRELAGNHATQATIAARPTYSIEPVGGRRNLLLWSEDFSNAVWVKQSGTSISAPLYADPDGSLTACLATGNGTGGFYSAASGVNGTVLLNTKSIWLRSVTGTATVKIKDPVSTVGSATCSLTTTWQRFSLTETQTAISNFQAGIWVYEIPAAGIYIWHPQLEAGSADTPYQRVTTQHDVTEAGVASVSYLYFDGAGDFMFTSTITPGTDKAQVFAGVRKLSDLNPAMLLELSANFNVADGSFYFTAPDGVGARYFSISRGNAAGNTAQGASTGTSGIAPDSAVLTVTHDIAGDLSTISRNAVLGTSGTGDKGTGNFLANPLYIGARSGGSLSFLGHLYSLITRFGPTLDAPTITSTETWVAGKTGIVI